jgi:hypothetical protein
MSCIVSDHTQTTTAQNKGSKQRLKAKAHKQTNHGRRKYHKKNHSPRIQTRIIQSMGDVNKGDVEIQQALQYCRRRYRDTDSHTDKSFKAALRRPSGV